MKYVIVIARVLLGLVFVVFGANGYMHAIAALQIVGGLCLLLGARFVPLGLTLLGPIIVNIVLFHIFLEPKGLPIAVVTAALALFLLWIYRFKFPAIFQP
jgi:hypothetical protein